MDFDVVIVGGGPAGLSAAYRASQLGCKVAIFEKSKEIGYPIHTSGGSWTDELQKLNVPEEYIHPIKIGEFLSSNSKATFEYKTSPSCILNVRRYYQYLAEKTSLAGSEIFVNTNVIEPLVNDNFIRGVIVRINRKYYDIRSKVVVDASGFNSVIARKVNLLSKFKTYGIGAEYELIAPSWNQEKVCFILNSKIAPAGYGWFFPCGNFRVRVGLAIIHPLSKASPIECLDSFLSSNNEIINCLKPISKIEFHQGLIPNDGVLPKAVFNGLLVVGDAAGQISAIVGEGIRFALDIGDIAGRVAAKAVLNKNYSENYLMEYEKKWRKKYELKFKIAYEINKHLRNYTDNDWDEKVEILSHLSPDLLVDFLKGNFTTKFFLKAIKQHPKLVSSNVFKVIKRMLRINIKI